jgi:hypothetical protein
LARDHVLASGADATPVTEVIRPAAVVPEEAARAILVELSLRDVRAGGLWLAEPRSWHRFDRPFDSDSTARAAVTGGRPAYLHRG